MCDFLNIVFHNLEFVTSRDENFHWTLQTTKHHLSLLLKTLQIFIHNLYIQVKPAKNTDKWWKEIKAQKQYYIILKCKLEPLIFMI